MEIIKTIIAILGFFGISVVFEKLPIKISPYTRFKKFLVADLENKIDKIENKFDNHVKDDIIKEKEDIRYKILTYHKAIKNGTKLSDYDIMCINSMYDRYHNELKGNSYISSVYLEIMELYKEQN